MTVVTTRLAELMSRGAGWPATFAVTAVAAALRLPALTRPHTIVFDETYYVKDAWTLLRLGYEGSWPDQPNEAFAAGQVDIYSPQAGYVVHPQVGKWVIALGLRVFGAGTPVGWRIGVLVAGLITVLLVTRIGRRLFGSTVLGCVAGLVVALDGLAIVHSRIALLDGILTMWLVAAFAALLVDRDRTRARLERWALSRSGPPPVPDAVTDAPVAAADAPEAGSDDPDAVTDADAPEATPDAEPDTDPASAPPTGPALEPGFGPGLGLRPYRLLAGVLLGLAAGTKWSALWFIAAFGLLSVAWDASARQRAGIRRWWQGVLVRDAVPAFGSIVGVAAAVYVATWASWFAHDGSYGRQWAASQPASWVPDALRSWWHYHQQMWTFHTELRAEHPYIAHAGGWLLQIRPTSFFYESPTPAEQACGADRCSQAITSLGNPFIWWFAAAALVAAVWWAVGRRDGIAAVLVAAVLAGWLPWFLYPDRPIFTFYAITILPFLALLLAWAVATMWRWASGDPYRRRWVATGFWVAGLLVVATTAFFWPLWTAEVVTYRFWQLHMWLPSWV